MATENDLDNTQPLDPQTEALRSMIRLLLEEHLRPIREQLHDFKNQLSSLETGEDAKARYVDLRARLAKMQEGLDVLNDKFDAQVNEMKYLRKSVRLMEDKVDSLTV